MAQGGEPDQRQVQTIKVEGKYQAGTRRENERGRQVKTTENREDR